ncbi:DUF6541 family protein [Microbacterium lushaniae]|uniref:Glycosyltransferase RgtA/B/C/D-like domain-containing protein n=1 Tax=Microbacterium lushaniae TaxID=2614639 RepID=A0A5J6L1P5_9MICO|nr:DUF6541 family protein [Microbacterium lushaniae]QEW02473.1 hypothetical protein F6J85_04725 [Microbacterium lushaniae]
MWAELIPGAVVAALLLFVVGGVVGWAGGLRGFALLATAPALTVAVIAVASVVAPWVGLAWSIIPVLIALVVAAAVSRALGRRRPARPAARSRFSPWLAGAVIAAAVAATTQVVLSIGAPDAISQTFDNVFHLNAVRWILDTGSASSLTLGQITAQSEGLAFYPGAWHALVALVVQLSGATIPVAVNATVIVVCALAWPMAAIMLTRALFGRTPAATVGAGLLSVAMPVFPILLLDYGVLYPYQLSLALVPVALALTLHVVGWSRLRDAASAWQRGLLLIATLGGVALAHPGGFVAWLALSTPIAATLGWSSVRRARSRRARVRVFVAAAVYLVVGAALLRILRPPADARGWAIQSSMGEAFIQGLVGSAWYGVVPVVAALAVLAGLFFTVRNRSRPAILAAGMFLVALLLFIIVASLPIIPLRDIFTGSWYNNIPRLAALLPLGAVPLGAYGIACSARAVSRRIPVPRRRVALPVLGAVAALVGLAASQAAPLSPVPAAIATAQRNFDDSGTPALLSQDERTLLERLDEHVPPGAVVAGNPWTGTSLAYALADRPVLTPHLLSYEDERLRQLGATLGASTAGDDTCELAREFGVRFVLEFGPEEVHGGYHSYAGYEDLSESASMELRDQVGDARLYELVGCDR